jgi:hypothetical protein
VFITGVVNGVTCLAIRPFQLGDILLIQRLRRNASELNIEQALLDPHPVLRTAFSSIVPWNGNGRFTFVLEQKDHHLARAGFIQICKRHNRPEADVVRLAPSLESRFGHPAIWQKLLVQSCQALVDHHILRLYGDPPDQPLLVETFRQAGFSVYTRETLWRLVAAPPILPVSTLIRPQEPRDEWNLKLLYTRLTPVAVQAAEGCAADAEDGDGIVPPILEWSFPGQMKSFVLERAGEIQGCVQLVASRRGLWLRLWTDTLQPNMETARLLLDYGVSEFVRRGKGRPLYISVREYQGGLGPLLSDYGFAPVTDRARMVKHIMPMVREPVDKRLPALEAVREAMPTSLVVPKAIPRTTENAPAHTFLEKAL